VTFVTEGIRLLRQERYEEALQAFRNVDADPGEYPELSYYIGLCYTHVEKYDEALLYLEQVVSSELSLPHLYQSRMLLGYIYAVTERYRLAEYEFNRLLEEGFESPKEYAALGYVLYAQNRVTEAIKYLERAVEIDSENANARNSLGYVLAEQGIRPRDALEHCRKAASMRPDNPLYLDSLGWALYANGSVEQAQKVLNRAQELAPDNEGIAEHLRAVMQGAKA
jgi:tetratricopeptide (TPR) repeat protein